MPNPNLELLELAAERLRQLLPEIVVVGGCATGLLIDDPAAASEVAQVLDPLMAAGGTPLGALSSSITNNVIIGLEEAL